MDKRRDMGYNISTKRFGNIRKCSEAVMIIRDENKEDLIWGSRVLFFGPADQGKSTLMGYIYARSQQIDMERYKKELYLDLGDMYSEKYLYSSLVNIDSSKRFATRKYNLRDFIIPDKDNPIVMTMIDTPGHMDIRDFRGARSSCEYGISKGNIGVLCLAGYYLDNDNVFEGILEKIEMWQSLHPGNKFIIAITQFFRSGYDSRAFDAIVAKIHDYVLPEEIDCIIPISIDFTTYESDNIFGRSANMPWYTGKTLLEAIKDQHLNNCNNAFDERLPRNLVFSIDKEIEKPQSNAGKLWRVFIENGTLELNEDIVLTSVKIGDSGDGVFHTATASIKDLRHDAKLFEDENATNEDYAVKGSIATLNLKNCRIDQDPCKKGDIFTSHQTIGIAAKDRDKYFFTDKITLKLSKASDAALISENQHVEMLYFGKALTIMVESIEDGVLTAKFRGDRFIVLPNSAFLQNLPFFTNAVLRIQGKNNYKRYVKAEIVYD